MMKVLAITAFLPLLAATREISFAAAKEQAYDYVIVGGGLSGLVVANRLSEDETISVLVIENGAIDDRPATRIPYFSNINTDNYYAITSAPEPFMQNKAWTVSVGNVVGGGTVINGMQFDRGSNADYDAWEELGNKGWGWKGLEKYFKKATSFEGPSEAVRKEFNITYDADAYGDGPLKLSIPSFQYQDYKPIWGSWLAEDIPHPVEGYASPIGTFWTPNTIDNSTQERCHARRAYYDPVKERRPKLHLLTNSHADEILFADGSLPTAKGIKVTSNADLQTASIYAKREVILAAGGVYTPHLLMVSGIGPKDVLSAANIEVRKDLAAVGSNFQDHPALYMNYKLSNQSIPNPDTISTNETFNATSAAEYEKDRTGPYTYGRGNALALLPFKHFSTRYKEITALIERQNATAYLPTRYSRNPALLKGYLAQRRILISHYLSSDAAAGEFPIQPWGRAATALQKPLSRGTITLNTTHPSANPVVMRNAFQNPVDKMVLGELVRWNRRHWTTQPLLSHFSPVEQAPGAQHVSDEEIFDAGIASGALSPTFAHASGGCALMPEELGGCVDEKLRVYGVRRLRVVDASVLPLIPAAHLMATMYAVAEKAADVIK
ncbi:choline dehydrogenase-like protein, partial [Westerdykella ornata]